MTKPLEGDVLAPDVRTPVDDEELERVEATVRTQFWATLRRALRFVPFSEELVAAYYCALDPETPFRVRATLMGALAYFVLPLDTIPDFILGVGFTDDVTVLLAALAAVRSHITEAHRAAAKKALDD
ncbi:MAG: YkvA family protein [Pseudomonadota bacterium]